MCFGALFTAHPVFIIGSISVGVCITACVIALGS